MPLTPHRRRRQSLWPLTDPVMPERPAEGSDPVHLARYQLPLERVSSSKAAAASAESRKLSESIGRSEGSSMGTSSMPRPRRASRVARSKPRHSASSSSPSPSPRFSSNSEQGGSGRTFHRSSGKGRSWRRVRWVEYCAGSKTALGRILRWVVAYCISGRGRLIVPADLQRSAGVSRSRAVPARRSPAPGWDRDL